jgi:hypothetical protein
VSGALLQLGLILALLVLHFPQAGNEDKVIGVLFPVVDYFEVGLILLIDVLLGGVHVGVGQGSVLVDVVVGSVGDLEGSAAGLFDDEDPPIVEGGAVPSDKDEFVAYSQST